MPHDFPPNNSGKPKRETSVDDLDTIDIVDPSTLKVIKERIIDPQASYIENVTRLIENEVESELYPNPDDFTTTEEYQGAVTLWRARIATLLMEAAKLHARMLTLEELDKELRAFSRVVDENRH